MLAVAAGHGDLVGDGAASVVHWTLEGAGEGFADFEGGEVLEGERDAWEIVSD